MTPKKHHKSENSSFAPHLFTSAAVGLWIENIRCCMRKKTRPKPLGSQGKDHLCSSSSPKSFAVHYIPPVPTFISLSRWSSRCGKKSHRSYLGNKSYRNFLLVIKRLLPVSRQVCCQFSKEVFTLEPLETNY